VNLKEFGTKHRLKVTVDGDGESVIKGKQGEIYQHSEKQLGVIFMPPSKTDKCGRWCPKVWGNLRRAGVELGMTVLLNGDSEGALGFDPANRAQVAHAIKVAKARVKKELSPERREALAAVLARARAVRVTEAAA
jgi:hypothetical protein